MTGLALLSEFNLPSSLRRTSGSLPHRFAATRPCYRIASQHLAPLQHRFALFRPSYRISSHQHGLPTASIGLNSALLPHRLAST